MKSWFNCCQITLDSTKGMEVNHSIRKYSERKNFRKIIREKKKDSTEVERIGLQMAPVSIGYPCISILIWCFKFLHQPLELVLNIYSFIFSLHMIYSKYKAYSADKDIRFVYLMFLGCNFDDWRIEAKVLKKRIFRQPGFQIKQQVVPNFLLLDCILIFLGMKA